MHHYMMVDEYINLMFEGYGEEAFLASWYLLQNMHLACNLTKALAEKLDVESIDGICVLAASGIPIGVLLAQAVEKPLYFYTSGHWRIDGVRGAPPVYPEIPQGAVVSLIDSHEITGFTASTCSELLRTRGVGVDRVITPISFQDIPNVDNNRVEGITFSSLSNSIEYRDTLFDILQINDWAQAQVALESANRRGKAARMIASRLDHGQIPRPNISFFRRAFSSLRSMVASETKNSVLITPKSSVDLLTKDYGTKGSDLWQFFTRPQLVKDVCLSTLEAIDINSYDLVVATGYPGLFLALSLAWHADYAGRIISTISKIGWDKLEALGSNPRVLICSMRLSSGFFILHAIQGLKRHGIVATDVLALRAESLNRGISRSFFLNYLAQQGVKVTVLSGV